MNIKEKFHIGFFGECMVELKGHPSATLSHNFAGDTLNSATYFRRLVPAETFTVDYITALGYDAFSDAMLHAWQREGLATQFVKRLKNKVPGIYYIQVDEQGERSFSYWRNQSAARAYFDNADVEESKLSEESQIAQLDGLYLSGISLAILSDDARQKFLSLLTQLKANGGNVYFDSNYRPALWGNAEQARRAYESVLQLANCVFATLDDELALFGDASADHVLARLGAYNIDEVILKRGAESCLVVNHDQTISATPPTVNKVVDTTAAGDAFSAAYLAARLQGKNAESAAKAANQLASTVIQHEGAIVAPSLMPRLF